MIELFRKERQAKIFANLLDCHSDFKKKKKRRISAAKKKCLQSNEFKR